MSREKVSIISLGCPKNLVDSERIIGKLLVDSSQFSFTYNADDAESIIINTCSFLNSSRKEAEDFITEFIEKKKRRIIKKIIVAGCYPSLNVNYLAKKFPEIDAFISTNNLSDILNALKFGGIYVSKIPISEEIPRISFTLPHYEYLKIADGCNHKCAFCLIPKIKGPLHSYSRNFLLQETKMLVDNGVKELMIIAQDVTQYGIDLYGQVELIPLLEDISKIKGLHWIRIMYSYPSLYLNKLLDYMKKNEKILPYIDMPIQHISNKVLKKMKRSTKREEIEEIVSKIKEYGYALRTSIIVGFPYEEDNDFEMLKKFLVDYEIDHVGIFEYSNEKNTESYKMPQISHSIKASRLNEIVKVKDEVQSLRVKKLIGKNVDVIIDYFDENRNISVGRTVFDAPEVDDLIVFREKLEASKIYHAKIVGGILYTLEGEIIK